MRTAPAWFVRELKQIDPLLDLTWNSAVCRWQVIRRKDFSNSGPQGHRRILMPCGNGIFKMLPLHHFILTIEDRNGEYREPGADVLSLLRFMHNREAQRADQARVKAHAKSEADKDYAREQNLRAGVRDGVAATSFTESCGKLHMVMGGK